MARQWEPSNQACRSVSRLREGRGEATHDNLDDRPGILKRASHLLERAQLCLELLRALSPLLRLFILLLLCSVRIVRSGLLRISVLRLLRVSLLGLRLLRLGLLAMVRLEHRLLHLCPESRGFHIALLLPLCLAARYEIARPERVRGLRAHLPLARRVLERGSEQLAGQGPQAVREGLCAVE
jgi:hypothetical protein